MTQQFGNRLVSYALTPGPTGRIAEKVERVGYRQTRYAYEYDPKGRLVQVSRDGRPVEKYGYDAAGRRSWDWSPQRGKHWLEYDRANRLRRAGDLEFYYRQDNTLGSRCVGKRQSLHLDYAPNLGLRSLHNKHGRAVNYRTNPAGQPLAKHADGEVFETFRWLDLVRLAEYRALDKGYRLAFHYRGNNRLPSTATFRDEEGVREWFLGYDQVGSLKAVADASGNLVKTIDYDSFGNVLSEDWPWLFIPIGFAGGLRDRDTDFVRFGHRDYDPEVGRFVAQDPLGDTGGDHDLYEYCVDDPVNAVDPKGLQPSEIEGDGNKQGVNEKGFYWTVEVENPKACDKCKEMAKKKFAEEPKRPHPNCKCKYIKNEVKISWTFDGSTLTRIGGGSWAARSGSSNFKSAPKGIYEIGRLIDLAFCKQNIAYCDESKQCWFCPVEPAFDTHRNGLGIHPDGNLPGTQGCIGISIKYKDTEELRKALAGDMGKYLRVK